MKGLIKRIQITSEQVVDGQSVLVCAKSIHDIGFIKPIKKIDDQFWIEGVGYLNYLDDRNVISNSSFKGVNTLVLEHQEISFDDFKISNDWQEAGNWQHWQTKYVTQYPIPVSQWQEIIDKNLYRSDVEFDPAVGVIFEKSTLDLNNFKEKYKDLSDEDKIKLFKFVFQNTPDPLKFVEGSAGDIFYMDICRAYNAGRENQNLFIKNGTCKSSHDYYIDSFGQTKIEF